MTDERYVDAQELAHLMGVSVPTIRRMTKRGMPSQTWGMRVRRYRPSECFAWAAARHGRIVVNINSRRNFTAARGKD